jgi:hypothetical protein
MSRRRPHGAMNGAFGQLPHSVGIFRRARGEHERTPLQLTGG